MLKGNNAMGAMMNARGLMELIIINIGLQKGIITGGLFAILGHNYTCFLKFKGGKGIATSAGVAPGSALKTSTIGTLICGSSSRGATITAKTPSSSAAPVEPEMASRRENSSRCGPVVGSAAMASDAGAGPGVYVYRASLDLTGFDLATMVISGKWATDNFGVKIRVNGTDVGFPNTVGTTYLHPQFALGSINRGDLWNQRRPLIAHFGTAAAPGYLQLRFLKNDYDFSSAILHGTQREGLVVGAVNLITNGGDTHISLDKVKAAKIRARDLRLRFELGGPAAKNAASHIAPPDQKRDLRSCCSAVSVLLPSLFRSIRGKSAESAART